jgi:polar amino acid transport system substrate-binding protein
MKKRLLTTALALTLGIATLAGCGSSSKDASTATSTEATTKDATTTEAAKDTSTAADTSKGTARTLSEIKESGKIVIGVFSDKKPFGYVDENGAYQGYDVYLGNRLAKDLGVEVEYVPVEAASRVEYLVTAKVDIILANFTVTEERAQQVDFALPYMKVALGVVSPDSALITDPAQLNGKTLIVSKGTTAETYFTENYPDVKLLKFDQYSEAYNALLDGRGDALSTDNTEVLAWALENKGYSVGIESLGSLDTIAPAVQKGNKELLDWINNDIVNLGKEQFFHADYEATLAPVYGDAADPENLVVEGGVVE